MSAIERCRTAALGGHVAVCEKCEHTQIAYNSCRNRHCPKCQAAAARAWLAAREAELLPVPYYHLVFTLPAAIADIAWQNKAVVYDLLFRAASETLLTIAADPRHLGAQIGMTAVLHTWGSALTHHPHLHIIVPGGGTLAGRKPVDTCRPGFFLPVRVLSRLFRRLMLEKLEAHAQRPARLLRRTRVACRRSAPLPTFLAPLKKTKWFVYSKRPFAGPAAVLAYLSRYTHRVAISNSRLIALDDEGVTFSWKDYRADGHVRLKTMTLAVPEFIRRFLLHVLPAGFHRIRHYGLLANGQRREMVARARQLLDAATAEAAATECTDTNDEAGETAATPTQRCPCCGGRMIVVETFAAGTAPRRRPSALIAGIRIDTS